MHSSPNCSPVTHQSCPIAYNLPVNVCIMAIQFQKPPHGGRSEIKGFSNHKETFSIQESGLFNHLWVFWKAFECFLTLSTHSKQIKVDLRNHFCNLLRLQCMNLLLWVKIITLNAVKKQRSLSLSWCKCQEECWKRSCNQKIGLLLLLVFL